MNEHLEITREQAQRIQQNFSDLRQKLKAEKCKGLEGIIKEGSDVLKDAEDDDVRDAAIIASALKVEHYEMAAYGTVRTWAQLLGEDEAAQLLQQTLNEEKEADQKLNQLAEEINVEAKEGSEGEEAEEEQPQRAPLRKSSVRSRRVA